MQAKPAIQIPVHLPKLALELVDPLLVDMALGQLKFESLLQANPHALEVVFHLGQMLLRHILLHCLIDALRLAEETRSAASLFLCLLGRKSWRDAKIFLPLRSHIILLSRSRFFQRALMILAWVGYCICTFLNCEFFLFIVD